MRAKRRNDPHQTATGWRRSRFDSDRRLNPSGPQCRRSASVDPGGASDGQPVIWDAGLPMANDPAPGRPGEGLPSAERLLALSDGVVAIAITLLVHQTERAGPRGTR